MRPLTRFTWNGDVALGYQVFGDGPDLVYLPPYVGSVDMNWREPSYARFLRRLASFSRVLVMDRRGWGVSDRMGPDTAPDLDVLVEDLLGVMDAANLTRPTLFACGESGFVGIEIAARYPDLFAGAVFFQCSPVWTRKDDMPWEQSDDATTSTIGSLRRAVSWDDWLRPFARDQIPSRAHDEAWLAWFADANRALSAPGAVIADLRWMAGLDLRDRLAAITVPSLVLGRRDVTTWPARSCEYMAERIPGARLRIFDGADVFPWIGDWEAITDEIQELVIGDRARPAPARSVTTVFFTDVVGSTAQAIEMGDAAWRELLGRHDEAIHTALRRFHGTVVASTGDGVFATFDSSADAVRCGLEAIAAVRELGLEIRAGVHTGEVERDGDELGGIAVHIGARVMSVAGASELLVSSTVKDLTVGSGLVFEDTGEHELKGVPDRWRLFRVVG